MSESMTFSRRSFTGWLSLLGSAALALFALPTWWARARTALPADAAKAGDEERGVRWGMTIDLDGCTGCGACVVACRTENNIPTLAAGPEFDGATISWMELLPKPTDPSRTELNIDTLPLPCMQCDNPPCVKVCPVGATYQTNEGIVAQIWDRCIGCRYCQVACPYSRRYFNWAEPSWPESHVSFLNPDVATRPKGVVEKCTFCTHRVRSAQEDALMEGRSLQDADVQRLPACAEVCPSEAIIFGDLNDDGSRVSKLSRSSRAFRLLEHIGTRPKVTYLSKDSQT